MNFIMRIIITSIVAFGLSYILSGVRIDAFTTANRAGAGAGGIERHCKTHPYSSLHYQLRWLH